VFTASFDGIPTILSALVGLIVFVAVTVATSGVFAPSPAPSAPTARDGSLLTGPVVRYQVNGNTPSRTGGR